MVKEIFGEGCITNINYDLFYNQTNSKLSIMAFYNKFIKCYKNDI